MGYQVKLIAIGAPKERLAPTINRLLRVHPASPVDPRINIAIEMATFEDARAANRFAAIVADVENEEMRQAIHPTTHQEITRKMADAATRRSAMQGFNGSEARLDGLLADCGELGSAGFVLYLV